MSRLEQRGPDSYAIAADSEDELALLDHARHQGGRLTLDDAYYLVDGERVLLPAGASYASAVRLKASFDGAVDAHRAARDRRGRFAVVPR